MIIDTTKKTIALHSFTVFPQDLNYNGTLFGGTVLSNMDLSGVKVVRRALYDTGADGCVTASFDKVDFHKPAFLGDIILMVAEIKAFGKTSIQVRIKVSRESVKGEIDTICAANVTFVAMKENKPFAHGLSFSTISN